MICPEPCENDACPGRTPHPFDAANCKKAHCAVVGKDVECEEEPPEEELC